MPKQRCLYFSRLMRLLALLLCLLGVSSYPPLRSEDCQRGSTAAAQQTAQTQQQQKKLQQAIAQRLEWLGALETLIELLAQREQALASERAQLQARRARYQADLQAMRVALAQLQQQAQEQAAA